MDLLTVAVAQYLPVAVLVTAVLVLARLPARTLLPVVAQIAVALLLAAGVAVLAGAVYDDPRPFVLDPSSPALFPHAADKGFPSDHTLYSAVVAFCVFTVRRRVGLVLVGLAVLAGLARVAANVHHLQDIVGALLIAGVAALVSGVAVRAVCGDRTLPVQ